MTAIEAGRRNLSLHQLGVLARVLRVSLPYLLGEPLPPGQFAHETYAGLPPFSQP
jgi:hypothetical protein